MIPSWKIDIRLGFHQSLGGEGSNGTGFYQIKLILIVPFDAEQPQGLLTFQVGNYSNQIIIGRVNTSFGNTAGEVFGERTGESKSVLAICLLCCPVSGVR